MALKVISHSPSINATGVFINETIRIYFDQPIEPTTVNWNTISVNDKASYSTVVGELGVVWSSGGTVEQVTFVPTIPLIPNNEYSVYVFGAPNSILSKDGTEIENNYFYSFITGTGYYDVSGVAGIPTGIYETVVDTTLDNLTNSGFYVLNTDPKNQDYDVQTNLGQINILFNAPIYTSLIDISGYVTVEVDDVLN